MTDPIRCLAVRQPWAWALVSGFKDVENRSWSTDYRGPIAILGSTTKTEVNQLAKAHDLGSLGSPFGAILGVVDLVDIVPLSESLESNPWAWGPQCWLVANARTFAVPIPCKGKLNLFTLDGPVAEQVRTAIRIARPAERDSLGDRWVAAMTNFGSAEERREGLHSSYVSLENGAAVVRLANARLSAGVTSEGLVDRGHGKFLLGDRDGAIGDLTQAIGLDEMNARAYFIRSVIYRLLASDDERTAAELDPRFAEGAPAEEAGDA
ncbi:MAG: hypothetical protein ACLQVI_30675 [Polyangiaceae bacterium]